MIQTRDIRLDIKSKNKILEDQKPLVSVLMTAYNREKFIAEAIESVLASTYANFELIVVDDGSTDNTVRIARQYESRDERVKIYINERNLGDYPNRNKAAYYANGKYLKYVDSDDYIYPNGLEVLVNSMERFPLAGFGICSLKANVAKPFPFMLESQESYEYHFFGPGLFYKGPLVTIIRKDVFDTMNGFPTGRMISDKDMWHHMALKYPVVLMQDGIVWQRIHAEQELSYQNAFIFESEKIKWKYFSHPLCTFNNKQIKAIKNRCIASYIKFILSGIKHSNSKQIIVYSKCLWYVFKVKIIN